MHWPRSSHTSLTPRVEYISWILHGLMLLGVAVWIVFSWSSSRQFSIDHVLPISYLLGMGLVYGISRFKSLPYSLVFWPILAIDLVGIGWLIKSTGGIESDFFWLFLAIVPFAGYVRGLREGVAISFLASVEYFFLTIPDAGSYALPLFGSRVILLSTFTVATGIAAQSIRQSEERLLNALDKLNERTSELEQTQIQLQTIYETSRSLGELMSVNEIIERVLTIARAVLNYPVCEVYTWDVASGKLWLNGRADFEREERFDKPREVTMTDDLLAVITKGTVKRVVDRHIGRAIVDGNPFRAQLVAPMISEGRIVGLLKAESKSVNAFSERDERIFSVLASSAALALVNADLHQRMEKLTVIDELTNVYNYRYFRMRFEDEKRRTVRYGHPLSLVMVDIDWFKRLNDQYGHETGNVALRALAQVIQSCIRDVDILARYGGEEFIIILPQTSVDEAHVIGERIRRRVEEAEFGKTPTGDSLRMTVSIGITCYPDNGRPDDALVETVDQALYRAKGAGKNLVCAV